ncbi:teichoic acid translocation permease [Staphylococcus sp. 17KM0847]|uniref:teichoic acid translocation permease n=1 Tax=Staphylococcus sp. 17KM0847 TaxID=2583989 RepID=UPI0015DC61C7|nr:teichoic acid translocation permease [Staphylococcus sp. 17KM0847]QLK86370.1 teichoic acid translocation permease [Staphylococcus sp. 17KM0847]
MIENIIRFFHEIPRFFRYGLYRIKMHKRWAMLTFLIGALFIVLDALLFKLMGTLDAIQVMIDYRLIGAITFAVIWIAIYSSYRFFPRDYYVTRHFDSSPFLRVVLSGTLYSIILLLLVILMLFFKSVNTDATMVGILFYIIMSLFFIVTLSFLLGLIYILYPKLDVLFLTISGVLLIATPIFYIPENTESVIAHIFMLNPFYYLVNGMQQSVIIGYGALNHIGYHLYFLCFMGLMIVFSFALRDYVTQLRPNEHIHKVNKEARPKSKVKTRIK